MGRQRRVERRIVKYFMRVFISEWLGSRSRKEMQYYNDPDLISYRLYYTVQ